MNGKDIMDALEFIDGEFINEAEFAAFPSGFWMHGEKRRWLIAGIAVVVFLLLVCIAI